MSNSYGGPEPTSDPTVDTEFYKHAGVAITASAGDDGFGVEYPAASQFVTAVGTTTGSTVTVTSPGNQTGTVGTAASLQVQASDSASGQTLTYSATGLPAGLSISAATGLISGTPTAAATSSVTVTAKDTTGASGSASFSWVISASGTGGGCTAAQLLGNPGFESGAASPWSLTAGVLTSTSAGVPAHSGSWLAWLDGYGSAHTDTASQSVTIPATCKSATLSFWLEVESNVGSSSPDDTFTVQVLNSSGTVLARPWPAAGPTPASSMTTTR